MMRKCKGGCKKGSTIMYKLNRWMNNEGHYDVQIKRADG